MQAQFLCLGFQKCGTTTLWEVLRQHKGIALAADVKEPMYYRVKALRAIGGKKWYEKRYFGYLDKEDTRLRGEINAMLTTNHCADKLGKDFPQDTKFIFMMRDPVARAYSAYKYFMALGFLPMEYVRYDKKYGHTAGFHYYCKAILSRKDIRSRIMAQRLKYLVFSQSKYTTLINEYLQYFPKENMKFIFFEEFIKDQKGVCEDLYDFLGLEPDEGVIYDLKSNEGTLYPGPHISCKIGALFMGIYYGFFEFLDLSRRAPKFYAKFEDFNKKVQAYCVPEDTDHSKMDDWTKELLQRYYKKEVAGVEEITGRDLSTLWYDCHLDTLPRS